MSGDKHAAPWPIPIIALMIIAGVTGGITLGNVIAITIAMLLIETVRIVV